MFKRCLALFYGKQIYNLSSVQLIQIKVGLLMI
jgi:hypothetical protein